jgi:hypothetical protein
MSDRAKDSAKLGVLLVGLLLVAAVPDVAGLLGCSSSGGGPGTGGGGAAGTGSGTGGQAGSGGDNGGGNGGASAASGSAGVSGTTGSAGVSGTTGAGGTGGGVAGSGGIAGGGTDGGSDGPPLPPTITMLTPSSAHVGDPGFTLVVEGHDFPANPRVSFDGNVFNTTVVSATRLEASIPGAALGATPRQVSVLVTRISGSSANSNVLPFQILPAQDGG